MIRPTTVEEPGRADGDDEPHAGQRLERRELVPPLGDLLDLVLDLVHIPAPTRCRRPSI